MSAARIIRRNAWRAWRGAGWRTLATWQTYRREVEGRGWRRRGIFRY